MESDEALFERVRRGELAAYEALYKRWERRLFGFIRGYLDDGATPRSTASALAGSQAMPFAKADFTIDSVPTSAEIDRTLIKLETLAKERGLAVGVASALPISIERIAAWIKTLDNRGIMLVPLTTAMLKSKSG